MESKLLRPLSQAVALALAAGGAHAAAITVTDGGDAGTAGTCTLRQAIVSANADSAQGACTAGSGADTITFAAGLANSNIALQSGQLLINSSVTITGSGQTIAASGNSRVMEINSTNTVATVTLSDLTLTGGNYSGAGAGLAIKYGNGPVAPASRTQLNGPTAIAASGPNVTLNQVTISNNTSNVQAGGLFISNATVAINQSSISGNTLTATGNYGAGGVYITNGSAVTITDSTISGNSASGSHTFLTGGVYVYRSALAATNSTVTGNRASGGNDLAGGISLANSSAGIYDSTVTGNSTTAANVVTGGILVGNQFVGAGLNISNSILAANTGPIDMRVFGSSNVIAQSNLMGAALSGAFAGNGNVFNDAPGLGALANNGGPTLTMLPLAGSPALGAGNVALIPAGVTTDQRGAGYARVVSGSLDLGSVEAAAAPVAATPTPTPALSRWAMLALGGLLGLFGLRKRKRTG
ncbi:MAG TPA: right-handed parallel beta-helix repeat-containing protein [Rudaea sp.]|nr:right-handed parallel beta-helix repeat-containing protein [Rudaea sp.]